MALDDNSLKEEMANDNDVEKLMAELKMAEEMDLQNILADDESEEVSFDAIPEDIDVEIPEYAEGIEGPKADLKEQESVGMETSEEMGSLEISESSEETDTILQEETEEVLQEETEEVLQEETEEILQEEFVDMDEIDAILSDVSDIHPERNVSAKELQDRIDRYAENPEEAERLLEEEDKEDKEDKDDNEDFLSNLENVEDLLASVEQQAKEEEAKAGTPDYSEDADLAEINDLINKSENNEAINDELLSMIDGMDDLDPSEIENIDKEDNQEAEEEEKPGKKKKDKKKKKKKKGQDEAGEENTAESEDSSEKKGLFAKLFGFMTEEVDEEDSAKDSDKSSEEGETKEKSGKKDKKKKDKKGAKGKDNASIEAELDEEDKNSKKKDKKKKDKKPKKDKKKKPEVEEPQEKSNIKKGGVIFTFAFCLTLIGLILILCVGGTRMIAKKEARIAYYKGDYETASNKLYGMKLNKSDELIFKKASLMYRLTLLKDKVEAYEIKGNERQILDAMFELRKECDNVYVDAKLLNITDEVNVEKEEIEQKICQKYGLEKEDVDAICQAKKVYYTVAVDNLLAGEKYYTEAESYFKSVTGVTETAEDEGVSEKDEISEEPQTELLEDMLPEEAE